jgi:membrane protein YqaA with SNARE-associated domain
VSAGGRFGLLLTLQLLLDAMLLAAIIVATLGGLLKWYMASFANAPSAISSVVRTRDYVERTIDSLGWPSAEAWIVCLAALALVWLAASRSVSRRCVQIGTIVNSVEYF